MAAAAAVPLSQVNDSEFMVTLTSCNTPTEWGMALRKHPDALGLGNLTNDDINAALQAACSNADDAAVDSPVCRIGRQQGLI